MARRLFIVLVAFVALWGVMPLAGCASPTLPLPPPALPTFSTQGLPAGQVKLQSVHGAEPNALIVIYNHDPSVPLDKRIGGAQADGSGSWDAVVVASPGDYVDITQESGTDLSPPLTVQIPMGP